MPPDFPNVRQVLFNFSRISNTTPVSKVLIVFPLSSLNKIQESLQFQILPCQQTTVLMRPFYTWIVHPCNCEHKIFEIWMAYILLLLFKYRFKSVYFLQYTARSKSKIFDSFSFDIQYRDSKAPNLLRISIRKETSREIPIEFWIAKFFRLLILKSWVNAKRF